LLILLRLFACTFREKLRRMVPYNRTTQRDLEIIYVYTK
jgi:hypothetical protein